MNMIIKVISQNVMCWERSGISTYEIRRPLLNRLFHEYDADIICMQEVTPKWEKLFDKDLSDFEKILVYRSPKSPEAVPIYWNPKKFKALDSGYFWLSETPNEESSSWNSGYIRITNWVYLKDLDSKKDFVVINTHLDNVSVEARINGLQLICDFVKGKFSHETPVILTGDFNSSPESATIQKANSLFRDTRKFSLDTSSEITYHSYGEKNPCIIDYIFTNDNVKSNKFDVIKIFDKENRPQSDHYAVFAELEI